MAKNYQTPEPPKIDNTASTDYVYRILLSNLLFWETPSIGSAQVLMQSNPGLQRSEVVGVVEALYVGKDYIRDFVQLKKTSADFKRKYEKYRELFASGFAGVAKGEIVDIRKNSKAIKIPTCIELGIV